MKKVLLYSALLLAGLLGSQLLPGLAGDSYAAARPVLHAMMLVCLAFIMIRVGLEFEIDKTQPRQYAVDYGIAATAAGLPWVLVALYFIFVLAPAGAHTSLEQWKETLLLSRFSAPTSAGILFSMLAAAGLASTWVYRKARVLAIFDDLDTVLLMIPLQMWMIGFQWNLLAIVFVMGLLLWAGWRYLHACHWPAGWPALLAYAGIITLLCETSPVHVEVLLPAFILGCMIAHHAHAVTASEERVVDAITGLFLMLVGLSMPSVAQSMASGVTMSVPVMIFHVLMVTLLSNIGKMFALLCYREEASFRERLAVSIAMFPRGEVGAGVLAVTMGYGIGGPAVTVAMLSLTLNLVCTGVFIGGVKKLLKADE